MTRLVLLAMLAVIVVAAWPTPAGARQSKSQRETDERAKVARVLSQARLRIDSGDYQGAFFLLSASGRLTTPQARALLSNAQQNLHGYAADKLTSTTDLLVRQSKFAEAGQILKSAEHVPDLYDVLDARRNALERTARAQFESLETQAAQWVPELKGVTPPQPTPPEILQKAKAMLESVQGWGIQATTDAANRDLTKLHELLPDQ